MSRPTGSGPGPGLSALLAAGALGAVAATALCALWRGRGAGPSCGALRRPSRSHSGAFEGSVSRIGSDASYLEENLYDGVQPLHDDDELEEHAADQEDEPSVYMCPHCSNYINANELIVPSLDGDDDEENEEANEAHAARVLSAAEALSIQLALKESLQQIFRSVDEDGDGVITREEMGGFLKKLGLTGDREQAFLNIVGGDSVQTVQTPHSSRESESAPPSRTNLEKRGSENGSARSANSASTVVGINFKQFFDRFQETLEGMDDIHLDSPEDETIAITTTQVDLDPEAKFAADTNATAASSTDATVSAGTDPSSAPILFTPPRGSGPSRLTVNTLTPGCSPALGRHRSTPSGGSLFSSTLFSPNGTPSASPAIRVFLGGACGETTWRKVEAIPQFMAAGITFYDPQVKEWSTKLVALEGLMKAWCRILFFVIGARTRALASMIEVAALIAAGRRVVLVVEPVEAGVEIEGQVPSASELKDLNRAREYLRDVATHYAIPVHTSADAGIKAIIGMEEEERRERERERARFAVLREATMGAANGAPGSAPRGSISLGSARRGRGSILSAASSPLVISSPSGGAGHRKASSSTLLASIPAGSHPPPNMPTLQHSQSVMLHSQGHPPHHPIGGGGSVHSSPQSTMRIDAQTVAAIQASTLSSGSPLAASAPPPANAPTAAPTTTGDARKAKERT